jgi:signal transduction histidine kinase
MNINLWVFLSIAVIFLVSFLTILVLSTNKKKIKELEVEALKLEKSNVETEVAAAANKILGNQLSRIEALEAIVTDKNYDLNEKITRL